jgi:hypothetical protein
MTDQYLIERQQQKLGLAVKEEKKTKPISNMSEKRKEEIEDKKLGDAWFAARHREMTGKCLVCGEKTCKGMDEYKCSVAHLLPKAIFKSIKWHEENWLELCFYGKSHHTNFDNNILTLEDLQITKAWPEIVRKFKILYPRMTSKEKGRVPDILIQELNETE